MNSSCIRIAIIGAGSVGSTTAYALMLKNIAAEIMLVDIDCTRCMGEVLDLEDAASLQQSASIRQASIKEAGAADIILLAAGARQQVRQSRTQLLDANKEVISSIIKQMQPINKQALIIVISNPVDIMTRLVQITSGLPTNQVFGSGTILDSLRLRVLLKQKIGIAEQSIHAYILGEHGDTQFPVWSSATIAGIPITQFSGLTQSILDTCADQARQKVYDIIACKQATYFGVATCVAVMCEAILCNTKQILPLSTYVSDLDVCLSVPCVLGRNGIEQILLDGLNGLEREQLAASARVLKEVMV